MQLSRRLFQRLGLTRHGNISAKNKACTADNSPITAFKGKALLFDLCIRVFVQQGKYTFSACHSLCGLFGIGQTHVFLCAVFLGMDTPRQCNAP